MMHARKADRAKDHRNRDAQGAPAAVNRALDAVLRAWGREALQGREPGEWEQVCAGRTQELGRRMLEEQLQQADPAPVLCPTCGQRGDQPGDDGAGERFRPRRRAARTLATLLGEVRWTRRIWQCARCGAEHASLDAALGLKGAVSAGLAELCRKLQKEMSVRQVKTAVREVCGVRIGAATVHRLGHTGQAKRSGN